MKDIEPSGTDRNKAVSDAPPMLDEILAIAPGLETEWSKINATIPAGTLVNRAEPGEPPAVVDGGEGGEPGGESPAGGEPGGEGGEESFIPDSFDLDSIDPAARPAVEALQKDWMGHYTQTRQAERAEIAEIRREAEQSAALIDGLRDASTLPHYLRLMGIDLSDAQIQQQLGIGGGGAIDEETLALLDDEPDVESRIEKIERERAEEVQRNEAAQYEEALGELADQELEKIEQAWGRDLTEDEDFIIRSRAEANPGPDGLPDYESAAAMLKSYLGTLEQGFAEKRSEAGRGAPGGKPGGKALDPNKQEDREALAAEAAERAMASQN